jgi:hypothetical protein
LTPEEQRRLNADPVYQEIRRLHEEQKSRFGKLPESWPLIREDRER